jgi:hypothetical protein
LWWLFVIDSLAISTARKIIARTSFTSITGFLEYWFIHFLGLIIFATIAAVCVLHFRKFWLRNLPEAAKQGTRDDALFSVLMTVLVASIFAILVAGAIPSDDFDEP